MKAIIAEINTSKLETASWWKQFDRKCSDLELPVTSRVESFDELKLLLESEKEEKVILFTNFPPNSSFPDSGKQMNYKDKGSYISRSWDVDSYSRSKLFFRDLDSKYHFQAIHFLTGAPEDRVSDEDIAGLFSAVRITVTRRALFLDGKVDYWRAYSDYLIDGLSEYEA